MSVRGQLFADHWVSDHVHGHATAADEDASRISSWVDALIDAAMAEGITRSELEAEIGDLADLVSDAMCPSEAEPKGGLNKTRQATIVPYRTA